MIRPLYALLCLLLVACVSPEEARKSSLAAYEEGDIPAALKHLDSLPVEDYKAANLRALYHISAAVRGGGDLEFNHAFDSLRKVQKPTDNSELVERYLTFLRFVALGNLGRKQEAAALYEQYCDGSMDSDQYRDCIRLEWLGMSAGTKEIHDDDLHRDLFSAASRAYLNVYGWDPQVFQNAEERRAFLERISSRSRSGAPETD